MMNVTSKRGYHAWLGERVRRGVAGAARYRVVVAILVAVVGASVLAWGTASSAANTASSEANAAAPTRGGTLNIDIPLEITGTDVDVLPENVGSFRVGEFIFDGLVTWVSGKSAVQPSLATSWTISKNGETVIFYLRKNVEFSNGDPFTAADVVFSLELNKKFALATGNACCTLWKSITALNKYTVKLVLSAPQATVLDWLAGQDAGNIIDAKYFRKVGGAHFTVHPVATGPFMVKSLTTGFLQLVRNPHYWIAGEPYLNAINVRTVADASTRVLAVKSDQAQVATEVPFSIASSLKHGVGTTLIDALQANTYVGQIDSNLPPLSNVHVRRAISYASDRAAILKVALGGFGSISNSISDNIGTWNPKAKQLPYSLTLAKQELVKAGYPNGFPLQIQIETGDETASLAASILQTSFDQIGIKTSILAVDAPTFVSNTIGGNYQLQVDPANWWVDNIPQVDPWFEEVDIPGGAHSLFTWYNNPTAAALATKLENTPAGPTHTKLAYELQQINNNNPPILSWAFIRNLALIRSNVCNFALPTSNYLYNMANVYLAAHC